MVTLLLLTAAVIVSAFWGWQTGALRVVSRLAVLVLAYALTWQETGALARYLTEQHWLPGVLVWPAAAAALFIGGSIIFSLCIAGLVHLAPEEWTGNGKKSGALMGGVLGCVIGLFLVWTVGVLQDAIAKRQSSTTGVTASDLPTTSSRSATDQLVHDFAANTVANAATAAMGDSPTAELAGEMLRSPLSVGEGFKYFAEQPDLRLLLQDPQSYAALVQSTPDVVMQLPHFRAMVADTRLMHFLESTGLEGNTQAEREHRLATQLSTYARNFEQLRLTAEYQALAADPNFQNQLKTGQWLELLANEQIRGLAEMLVNPDTAPNQADAQPSGFTMQAPPGQTDWSAQPADAGGADSKPAPTKSIYRWRDADGRIHLTDEKPPEGTPYDAMVN